MSETRGARTYGDGTLLRSEIVAARAESTACEARGGNVEVTFDDLFREQFIPLDARKKVGEYVIGRTLGEGSFSKVRLGKHVHTKQKVAIKVIPKKTIVRRQEARRRFIREMKAMRKVNHENVVQLREVMETAGNYYLVMDLAIGISFKEHLQDRTKLSEGEMRPYLCQIVNAVHYMHSVGIIHRDLKPGNLMLEGNTIKILDFGLSACVSDGHLMTTQCGSPAYAAPEIFNKQPYNQSVDVWSIGVILYLALTGDLPFVATSSKNYTHIYAVILKGYPSPRSLTPACQNLISQLLQIEPSQRISTPDLLTHPWMGSS